MKTGFLSRLATRVLVVVPMIFIMTQQRTRTICNPKLIALGKNLTGQSDIKGAKFYHFIEQGK